LWNHPQFPENIINHLPGAFETISKKIRKTLLTGLSPKQQPTARKYNPESKSLRYYDWRCDKMGCAVS